MKLVVGLGNPGKEYAGTRHNIGFEVVERLATNLKFIPRPDQFKDAAKNRYGGLALEALLPMETGESERILMLQPMTYMNLSGQAVMSAMAFFQIPPEDIMVVLDDIALPCGTIRMRSSGSSGGHNGLKDITRVLGHDRYPRLRLGIDPVTPPVSQKDYVLQKFTEDQRKKMTPAIDRACASIITWVKRGIAAAMSQYNAPETGQSAKDDN